MNSIEVFDLKKVYGDVTVLDIPSLSIPRGQSFGLVGNNGAGKTTFFRLILDLIRAEDGYITSRGERVAGSESWKPYTGSYLDRSFLIDFLTPEEYFDFLKAIFNISEGDMKSFFDRFEGIFNQEILGKKKYIRDLSSGNRQKVGIAAAMMANPEVLILDEPFLSLDPTTQLRLKKMLNEWREDKNITMLISSHDLNHITEVCDRIAILEKGKIVQDKISTTDTLKDLEAYFSEK